MKLTLSTCEVRSWRASDADALVKHADNRKIWLNLRDRFPHPYTKRDARRFIRAIHDDIPETVFAIAVDDEAVGGIGFMLHTDVERVSAEIGYWLGERFWGRGIATEALAAMTRHAIESTRAHAGVCRAVRVEHGVVSRAREGGLRPRGAAPAERDQRRPGRRPASEFSRLSRRRPEAAVMPPWDGR